MRRIGLLTALATTLLIGAGCGDDDGDNALCGNDAIEGVEICDGNQIGGADCVSQGFGGGTLTCDDTCDGYDTSQCTSGSCGDGIVATDEDCDTTNLDGNDCASVGNWVGGTLACAGDCTFDTSNCTPPLDCGNNTIDAGEDCDASNLDGNDCSTVGGGFAGGSLACAGDCTFNTGGCVTTSEQITAARATADGTVNVSIDGAWVTYIRDGFGSDPAGGFFVQAEHLGPALFVQADAATMGALAVGDEVSFEILEMGSLFTLRMATVIANLSIDSSGNNVTTLYQDVGAATDLITGLDSYESEMLTLDATLTGTFESAGPGYDKAAIDTDGIPGGTVFVRIPSTVLPTVGLTTGCTFSIVGAPMWRFNGEPQVGLWSAADVTLTTCPAPEVTGAEAQGAVDVDITFNTAIDAASLTDVPGQITFDQGVTAVSAVVNGPVVTVTTDGLGSGVLYTTTVANTVTDLLGTGVLATANSATFLAPATMEIDCTDGLDDDLDGYFDCLDSDCSADAACAYGAQLYIWELDSDQVSTDTAEFVEIWNNTGGDVDLTVSGIFLLLINGSDDLIDDVIALNGTVLDGEVFVAGMAGVANVDQTFTGFLQNGQDGLMLVSCVGCGTTDFLDNLDPTPTAGTFGTSNGRTATVLDAVAYDTNDPDDVNLMAALGVSEQFNEGTTYPMSLIRTSLTAFMQAVPDPGNSGIQP